jgi:hypothetical protein
VELIRMPDKSWKESIANDITADSSRVKDPNRSASGLGTQLCDPADIALLDPNEVDAACRVGPASPNESAELLPSIPIDNCTGCGHYLGWKSPAPESWASPMECPGCQRWHYTRCENDSKHNKSNDAHDRSAIITQCKDWTNKNCKSITERLLAPYVDKVAPLKDDRRHEQRYDVSLPLVGIPIDFSGATMGECLNLTLSDLSFSGAGMISRGVTDCPQLLLDFAAAGLPGTQLLLEIRWSRIGSGWTHLGGIFTQ